MSSPNIARRGPFVVEEKPGVRWWCACGLSASQPYCDGSHKGTGMAPLKVEIAQDGRIAWCGCKRSRTGAFCDGSHRSA